MDCKFIKQFKMMNDVCYNKVIEYVGKNWNQMLIFVYLCKEIVKIVKFICDKVLENEIIN